MRIEGTQDVQVEAFEDAELRKWGQVVFADHLVYNKPNDEVFAEGNVRLEQKQDVMEGPELRLKLEKREGYLKTPKFWLPEQNGRGDAQELLFEGPDRYRLRQGRYNTCPVGQDDWFIRAADLELDRVAQVGTARNASVVFKGVPILYSPYMSFPLTDQRKSGFLSPSFGSTGNSGAELTLPYYWNIAPNRDATISPRLMQKRGLQVKNEFRYLEPAYSGIANLDILPNDRVSGTSRSFASLLHQQDLGDGWRGSLNLQRTSDDAYFRDLGTQIAVTSQTNLPREGILSYAGGGWRFSGRIQRFQTLQDPLAPVVPPYHRLPQLTLVGSQPGAYGTQIGLSSEYVQFSHPTLVNGNRLTLYPSVSLPVTQVWGYLTPKLGLHYTRYNLDENTASPGNATRTLPIFSLDSGLTFERPLSIRDNAFLQTLEPRLYYLYIPSRDQSKLPNFDSAEAGFNFAQIFSENQFVGGDRINDANQVTLAVTSRLLDPASGLERLRIALGQRYYFKDQQVTLTSPPRTAKYSDILASLGGSITPALTLDGLWQYDPDGGRTKNFTFGSRYRPQPGKVFNASYRYNIDPANPLKQIDLASQWPLSARWHGLGRWNYSLLDGKIVEGLAGLEYNAGCWVFRAVVHSFATGTVQRTNSVFFLLELGGVSQIGSNPFEVLRRNIYGYAKTNEITSEPRAPLLP
jgi:LPS-assembly protein